MAIDIIAWKSLPKRLFAGATCVAVIAIIGLLLFPPWSTFLYDEVNFHWFRDAPPPLRGLGYQINVVLLEMRIVLVVLAYVVALMGNHFFATKPTRSFWSLAWFGGPLFALSFVGLRISSQIAAQATDYGWPVHYISTMGLLVGGILFSGAPIRGSLLRRDCSEDIALKTFRRLTGLFLSATAVYLLGLAAAFVSFQDKKVLSEWSFAVFRVFIWPKRMAPSSVANYSEFWVQLSCSLFYGVLLYSVVILISYLLARKRDRRNV